MLKKIAIVVVVLIAGVLIYAATKPDSFAVKRSLKINASSAKLFPLIDNLHGWNSWSPYEKYDPAMKRTYEGPESGVGAAYAWDGNSKVGQGRMEVIGSTPDSEVKMKLDFLRPFEGHNVATFSLQPEGDATLVTWAMDGPAPYISKLMGVFFNMDEMIGKDFADGLENLKKKAE